MTLPTATRLSLQTDADCRPLIAKSRVTRPESYMYCTLYTIQMTRPPNFYSPHPLSRIDSLALFDKQGDHSGKQKHRMQHTGAARVPRKLRSAVPQSGNRTCRSIGYGVQQVSVLSYQGRMKSVWDERVNRGMITRLQLICGKKHWPREQIHLPGIGFGNG
jgi:hypothetical protein